MLARPAPRISARLVLDRFGVVFPERDKFVDVEQQPRKMADEEDEDEAHEDGRQIVLEAATALVNVLEGKSRRWKNKVAFLPAAKHAGQCVIIGLLGKRVK